LEPYYILSAFIIEYCGNSLQFIPTEYIYI
jgi:hypothetical protein